MTTSRISDSKAAKMCEKLIKIAVKKGVVMRPGGYIDAETVENKKGEEVRVQFACALGSIEHALALGEEFANEWKSHESLQRRVNHGISLKQLSVLEAGFENNIQDFNLSVVQSVRLTTDNPLYKLGKKLRRRARDILRKRFPSQLLSH